MVNIENQYLFHNVYGDADELIATEPESVITIAWGPDEQTENYRNQMIAELGITPSTLPSLIFWMPFKQVWTYINDKPYLQDIPAHWAEVRVADLPKPWNWEEIMAEVKKQIEDEGGPNV